MPKVAFASKALAIVFVILTVSAIAGLVCMIALYSKAISDNPPKPPPTTLTTTQQPPPTLRLPKNVIPQSYKITLQPHLYTRIIEKVNVTTENQTLLFNGSSTVNFRCVQKTSSIYLHSKDLKILGAELTDTKENKNLWISSPIHHTGESDFLEFTLDKALAENETYSLFLAFEGEISENLDALFVSTYNEGIPADEGDTNTKRYLAATNLQPTNARKVFPCFDEPEMKAVFEVTIIHRQTTTALGNERQSESIIVGDGWVATSFYPTPRMSTYLFAFTVSEFITRPDEVTIKTFARPEAITAGHSEYAASITGKILKFYENSFGIANGIGTLDQIALPDLGPAGMENWGLITYQESALLYDEGVSSELLKSSIASLIAHELAHQWFGNLVTMKWWNEIWLNEGFASYMSYSAVEHVDSSFMKEIFIMRDLHYAFEEDALASSHPLSPPEEDIQTNDEIMGMFDSITYCKGAIVLRMLADLVGKETFDNGIKMYIKDFSHKNTDQNNLWDNIQKAVTGSNGHTNVAEVMNSWTNQIGYPVVTINTNNGEIYQKHFLYNDSSESSLWWHIKINMLKSNTEQVSFMFESNEKVRKPELISENEEWLLANADCTGYYRVNYNPENWQRLLTQLETNPDVIPLMNRGQLVDDAFNLARAKIVDVALALNTTRFLWNETEPIPWESAVQSLEYFILMFDRSEVYGPIQTYLQRQIKGLYNYYSHLYTDLGNNTYSFQVPEGYSSQLSQIIAIDVACSNGLPECLVMASQMFASWMRDNTNGIPPNLRSVIYCQALAAGGKEEWEFAWKKFQSTSDTSEKEQLRVALSCTKTTWLLNRYLEYTLDPEKIRLMDVPYTITNIAKNVAGQALAWNFIRANWQYVSQGGGASEIIEGVTRRFSTQFELTQLESFARDYEVGPAAREVTQAIEQTRVNIQWVSENKDTILQWFERETAF